MPGGFGRKSLRVAVLLARAYILISVVGNALMWLGVAAGRALRDHPEMRASNLPLIRHLRAVDERLWAGAQPEPTHYRELAGLGVTGVVDLRTGSESDPPLDDPALLNELGMDYRWLPITDGHAPSPVTVRELIGTVEASSGIVFMHCGGGVGRCGSMAAAYEASQGRSPSLLAHMSIGPISLEQAWFIGCMGGGAPSESNELIQSVSRYVIDAPRKLWGKIAT